MMIVKLISAVLGIVFLLLGYGIYFRKKYHLINEFAEDFKYGRKTQKYASVVGLIEFVAGVVLLLLSALLFPFA